MQRIFSQLFLLFFLFFYLFSAIAYSQNIRLAVMGLEDKTKRVMPSVVSTLTDLANTYIFHMGRFTLIEREAISKVLKEQKLALSGLIDTTTAAKVGKLLGANYLLLGSIVNFGDSVQKNNLGGRGVKIDKDFSFGGINVKKVHSYAKVVLRIVEVETGKIIFSSLGESSYKKTNYNVLLVYDDSPYAVGRDVDDETLVAKILDEALKKALEKLYFYPFKKIPLTLRVIKVNQTENGYGMLLSGGSNLGVKVGDEFYLLGPEKSVIDPVTGEKLGGQRSKFFPTLFKIDSVKRGFSVARISKKEYAELSRYLSKADLKNAEEQLLAKFVLSKADKSYNKIVESYLKFKLKKAVYLIKKYLKKYQTGGYIFYYLMASSFERGGAYHAALKYYLKVRQLLDGFPLPGLDDKINLLRKKIK
jgi:curli biogenesis system outer membrane secretion channel CsgG